MDLEEFLTEWHSPSPTLLVHTSGSTGEPKSILVEKRRMEASARFTCNFLGLKEGDTTLLCMPLDYIAGKMVVVRALTCGLRLISEKPTGHPLATITEPIDFAAMVPLQVYNTMQVAQERQRLMAVRHLIIGGGAVDESLRIQLHDFPNAVWSTYGMTETLSHIALRRLNGQGASDWYTPFEGVTVSLSADDCLVIDAPAVHTGRLVTHDIAELRSDGTFRIMGRMDNVVCSGGIKIQIEEVERLLRPSLPYPFQITRVYDERLGQAVVLLLESDSVEETRAICQHVLPKYWLPRHIVAVTHLPITATGKPARQAAELLAAEKLNGIHPRG